MDICRKIALQTQKISIFHLARILEPDYKATTLQVNVGFIAAHGMRPSSIG